MESKMISSPIEYANLVEIDYKSARWAVAPAEIWFEILDDFPHLKDEVVLNKKLPDSVLELLARDDDSRIRSLVSRKRKLSYDLFQVLAFDIDESVRMGIATNAKTPAEILEKMKEDSWGEIVEKVNERLSK